MNKILIEKNRYVDSVTLMGIGEKVKELDGIKYAEAQMATPANIEIIESLGFEIPENISSNDLILAVSGNTQENIDGAMQMIRNILDGKYNNEDSRVYRSLDDIDQDEDPYDLVQISLPGEYAYAEAKKALEKGLDVFIFSDNVPIEEELELKQFAQEKGLIVMGPDSGVGLIGGVTLAAGSIIRKGPVGIVAASGSGAQEIACIIEKCGYGVSSIIGTGGRDLYPQIGGLSMIQGIKRLEADEETSVIVLVSKLADLNVMKKVLTTADDVSKPVIAVFLGGNESLFEGHKVMGAFNLEEAALKAISLLSGKSVEFGLSDEEINNIVSNETIRYNPEQKYLRSLYCGGTFTEESLIYYYENNKGVTLYSNLDNRYTIKLSSHLESKGHTILDLGSEDFTSTAPHPIFDPEIRLKRFKQELQDPQVAVIILDFIAGPGVHFDPITPFVNAYLESKKNTANYVTIIASVCGSLEDPQNVTEKEKLLKDAGVILTKSNYQSARLSSALLAELERRNS